MARKKGDAKKRRVLSTGVMINGVTTTADRGIMVQTREQCLFTRCGCNWQRLTRSNPTCTWSFQSCSRMGLVDYTSMRKSICRAILSFLEAILERVDEWRINIAEPTCLADGRSVRHPADFCIGSVGQQNCIQVSTDAAQGMRPVLNTEPTRPPAVEWLT